VITVFLSVFLLRSSAHAQQNGSSPDAEIHIWPVQGNVYMLVGDGANITVQVGDQGVLLVDTGLAKMSANLLAAVRSLSDKPVRYIIDTNDDPDHVGGNESVAKAGSTITGGNVVGDIGASAGDTATVIAFQSILDRMSMPKGNQSAIPQSEWPTDTYTVPQKSFWFNGESIESFTSQASPMVTAWSIFAVRMS